MTAAHLIEQTRITDVWKWLGGGEIRRGRGQAFWRRGDGYSVSLNNECGTWYDHRDRVGGGILDLIQHVRGGTRRGALRWLADWRCVGLDGDAPLPPADRRRYAQARQTASAMAADIEHWQSALAMELNARKVAAVEAGDFEALSRAAKLCRVLESGPSQEIASEFIRHRTANPKDTARLIAAGRERHLEAQRVTAEYVLLLAHAAEQEELHA